MRLASVGPHLIVDKALAEPKPTFSFPQLSCTLGFSSLQAWSELALPLSPWIPVILVPQLGRPSL